MCVWKHIPPWSLSQKACHRQVHLSEGVVVIAGHAGDDDLERTSSTTPSLWKELSEDELLAFLEELEQQEELQEQQDNDRLAAIVEEKMELEKEYWKVI